MSTFTFTNADHRQIDFMKSLLRKPPKLNSSQLIERTRSIFGVYPSGLATQWLYQSMGDFTLARDEVRWRQGLPRSRSNSNASGDRDDDDIMATSAATEVKGRRPKTGESLERDAKRKGSVR